MRVLETALVATALLAASPALAQETPFEATGEVRFLGWGGAGSGAAFDAERIVGPTVNLTRRTDGTWAGDLDGQDLDLEVGANKANGPNVNLTFEAKDGKTTVEGLFYGRRIRVELDKKRLRARVGACSMDLTRKNAQFFQGEMGCMPAGRQIPQTSRASLQLLGDAAKPEAPMPQLALALVAILPG